MRILLLTFVAFGFTFVVVLGVLSVVADLLALSRHRPPSIYDAFAEEDPDVDAQAARAVDINAGRPEATARAKVSVRAMP
ncbi:MAG TPA: hypothetical protein VGI51_13235 [Steroidobacteraceae bacterium]|jgi:hypothetical protein